MNFNQKCYELLSKIPKGKISTYKQIANILNTKAYRAVGNAMAKNPNPIIVPCHRVIKSDGHIGGYTLGIKKKIGDTEAGLLIGSVQNFKIPDEIELFNIIPPEHDKIFRWLSEKEKSLRSQVNPENSQENVQTEDSSKDSGLWTP